MSTFVWISIYAVIVLTLLTALSGGFLFAARWLTSRTYDPDAQAH